MIPNRIEKINQLVISLALCAAKIQEIKKDREQVNATLAMCEIAVSLPPAWFTNAEQTLVFMLIETLFGNSTKFVEMLSSGTLSYYAKARQTSLHDPLCNEITEGRGVPHLDDLIKSAHRQHAAKFGAAC